MPHPLNHALAALLVVLALLAAGCGSDTSTNVSASQDAESSGADGAEEPNPVEPDSAPDDAAADGGEPMPVEPDGGIGDGAEPLPGAADEPVADSSWHGPEVAETNCPGMEFKRVQATNFSFSVPVDFADNNVQGVDSEIGAWTGGNKMEVFFDYGWHSSDFSDRAGAEVEPIDYSGIVGKQIIVRDAPGKFVGVFFAEVLLQNGEWDGLNLDVRFTDPNDEIIGRCIVSSISWGG